LSLGDAVGPLRRRRARGILRAQATRRRLGRDRVLRPAPRVHGAGPRQAPAHRGRPPRVGPGRAAGPAPPGPPGSSGGAAELRRARVPALQDRTVLGREGGVGSDDRPLTRVTRWRTIYCYVGPRGPHILCFFPLTAPRQRPDNPTLRFDKYLR